MLKRPKPGEDEDELLAFQEKFLAEAKSKPAATLVKVNRSADKSSNTIEGHKSRENFDSQINANEKPIETYFVIGEIVERRPTDVNASRPNIENDRGHKAFPVAEKLEFEYLSHESNNNDPTCKKKKKGLSLFAQKMAASKANTLKNNDYVNPELKHNLEPSDELKHNLRPTYESTPMDLVMEPQNEATVGDNLVDLKSIHDENLEKLNSMSISEIESEQQQILARLDASTIEFLKNKSKVKTNIKVVPSKVPNSSNNASSEAQNSRKKVTFNSSDSLKSDQGKYIWESDLPEPDPEKTYSVRFDFQGLVVTDNTLPVNIGLHHHGDEQEVPGYTVDELFMLSKSSNIQQKIFAVRTLGLICKNAKLGCFVGLEINVFQVLVEKGLPVLFRLVLDDQNVAAVCVAIKGLKYLLMSQHSENVKEVSSLCSMTNLQYVSTKPTVDEKLLDQTPEEVMKVDLLAGLVRTHIIARFRYVLEVLSPPEEFCIDIVAILEYFSRHSMSLAYDVFKCPRLINFLANNFLKLDEPFSEKSISCLKLWKNLIANGSNMAKNLVVLANVEKFLLFCLTLDLSLLVSVTVKLEIITLINQIVEVLINYRLFFDQLVSVVSLVMMRTVKLQVIEFDKCSPNELKFLSSHFNFCAVICRKFSLIDPDSSTLLSFVSDCKSMTLNLILKWFTSIMNSDATLLNGLNSSVFAAMINLLNGGFPLKDANGSSITALFSLISKFLPSLDVRKLFDALTVNFPFEFVVSDFLTEPYFDCNVLSTSFYVFDFIKSIFDLCSEYCLSVESKEPLLNCLLEFSEKLLQSYALIDLVSKSTPDKKVSKCAGYSLFVVVVRAFYSNLNFLKSLLKNRQLMKTENILSICLKLISESPAGFPEVLKDLFCNILFDVNLHQNVHLNDQFSNLPFQEAETETSLSIVNEARVSFSSSFPEIFEIDRSRNCEKLAVIVSNSGPELPRDWIFYPILKLLNENESRVQEIQESSDLKIVQTCLMFLSFLSFETLSSLLSPNILFDRLMCVFMLKNQVFMDKIVRKCTQILFSKLVQCNNLTLDLQSENGSSFSEHYVALLEHFEAESFGDTNFANFVLLPMSTRFDVKYRRAVWTEYTNVFKVGGQSISRMV